MAIVHTSRAKVPIIVTVPDATPIVVSANPQEVVSIHMLNTTAGVCRVEIRGAVANEGVVLGSDAANGNDDWSPSQAASFSRIVVVGVTGTCVLSIQTR